MLAPGAKWYCKLTVGGRCLKVAASAPFKRTSCSKGRARARRAGCVTEPVAETKGWPNIAADIHRQGAARQPAVVAVGSHLVRAELDFPRAGGSGYGGQSAGAKGGHHGKDQDFSGHRVVLRFDLTNGTLTLALQSQFERSQSDKRFPCGGAERASAQGKKHAAGVIIKRGLEV